MNFNKSNVNHNKWVSNKKESKENSVKNNMMALKVHNWIFYGKKQDNLINETKINKPQNSYKQNKNKSSKLVKISKK